MHATIICNTRHNCKRQASFQIRYIIHEYLSGVMYILRNTDSVTSNYSCDKSDKSVCFLSVCCSLNYQVKNNSETCYNAVCVAYLAVKNFARFLITFTIFRKL